MTLTTREMAINGKSRAYRDRAPADFPLTESVKAWADCDIDSIGDVWVSSPEGGLARRDRQRTIHQLASRTAAAAKASLMD
jgi:hypothetical protein